MFTPSPWKENDGALSLPGILGGGIQNLVIVTMIVPIWNQVERSYRNAFQIGPEQKKSLRLRGGSRSAFEAKQVSLAAQGGDAESNMGIEFHP
jgi:hypothetical protein